MLIWGLLVCVGIVCQNTAEVWGTSSDTPKNLEDALKTIEQWKYMDYDFDSDEEREEAIRSGAYNRSNINPIDVDYWNGKFFITTVRDQGVPSTLNVVSNKTGPGGHLLAPYPDWSWANVENCSGIISVYRIAIDKCDRLWVMDTGVDGVTRKCPAQLLAFDLHTSTLIERIKIPDEIAINSTTGLGLLITPVIQTCGHNCSTTYVYISDARGNALIVYDGSSFRRLTSPTFDYDPAALTFETLGQKFDVPDGPVGMAISSITQNLYYSPMASYNLDYVSTRDLKELPADEIQYHEYKNILTTQATAKAVSEDGTLFFGLVNSTAIGCWNEFNELKRENIDLVAQSTVTLQGPAGVKIKHCNGKEVLLVLTTKFLRFVTKTQDFTDINYRILAGDVQDLVKGTCCQPPRYP